MFFIKEKWLYTLHIHMNDLGGPHSGKESNETDDKIINKHNHDENENESNDDNNNLINKIS